MVEDVLREALALGEDGRWEEMAQRLADALQDAPEDAYLLCWLGVAEQELGNDGAAYEYFKRCLATEPLDPHLLSLAGAGLAAFNDPDAGTALRAAVLTAPDIPMTRLHYGAYLSREGLHDEALEQLEAARSLAPDDPSVVSELAAARALKGDLSAAVEGFEDALGLAPDDSWTRMLLGLVLVRLERIEEAAEELWRAAEARDDDPEAQVAAALAAAAVGWEDAAHNALARSEYGAQGADAALIQLAEERIADGAVPSRRMLEEAVAPSMLRERLMHPL